MVKRAPPLSAKRPSASCRCCPVHGPLPDVEVRVVPRARWFVNAEHWEKPAHPRGRHRRSRGSFRFLVVDARDARHAFDTVWLRIFGAGLGVDMDRLTVEVEQVRQPGGYVRCETVKASDED
jgi:hypothetical protein